MPHVRQATPEDAKFLATSLRAADLFELRALGVTPLAALLGSIEVSDFPLAIVGDDEEPVALFGAAPTQEPMLGVVWLLGSDNLLKYQRRFIRECRQWIDAMHVRYPVLFNFVSEQNTVHTQWLRWCGFIFLRRVVFKDHIFFEFTRIKPCAKQPQSSPSPV